MLGLRGKIAVVEDLGLVEFIYVMIFSLRYKSVLYRRASPCLKRLSEKLFNIKQLSYSGLSDGVYLKSLASLDEAISLVDKRNMANGCWDSICDHLKLDFKAEHKFRCAIKNGLKLNAFGAATLNLFDHYQLKNEHTEVLPASLSSYIYFKNASMSKEVDVIKTSLLITSVLGLLKRIIINIVNASKHWIKQSPALAGPSRPNTGDEHLREKIAFHFSHGVFYGENIFKKLIPDSSENAELFNNQAMVLFDSNPDANSLKYVKENKIEYHIIGSLGLKSKLSRIVLAYRTACCAKVRVSELPYVAAIIVQILGYQEILKRFPQIKCIFLDYDYLSSRALVVACHLQGIDTISMQERSVQGFWNPYYAFDWYLVPSEEYIEYHKKYGSKNGHYYVTSFERSYTRNMPVKKPYGAKILNFAGQSKFILFVGLLVLDDETVGLYGEDGTSYESNTAFLNAAIEVSKAFPDTKIIIRYKIEGQLSDERFGALEKALSARPNIVLDEDINSCSVYYLADLADIIISKATSLIDEMASLGKHVIVFDSERYYQRIKYPRSSKVIIASTYEDLLKEVGKSTCQKQHQKNDEDLFKPANKRSDNLLAVASIFRGTKPIDHVR